MTSLTIEILGLAISYALLGVLLLSACLFTRLPWSLKAMGIVLTSTFYIVSFYATQGLLGWSSIDPLPPRFKLLHARIVEPHSLAGERSTRRTVRAACRAPIACPMTPNLPKRRKPPSRQAPTAGRRAAVLRIWGQAKAVRAR